MYLVAHCVALCSKFPETATGEFMKIAFHGAARYCYRFQTPADLKNGKKILLDCGMFQGMGQGNGCPQPEFWIQSGEVDVMILSHAHIDHSGLIPKFVKEGFAGKIFCTPATKELTTVLLLERFGRSRREDVKYRQ